TAFECKCGSPDCRGKVLAVDGRRIVRTDLSVAYYQPFIQAKLNRLASHQAVRFSQVSFPSHWQRPEAAIAPTSLLISESVLWENQPTPSAARRIAEGEVVFFSGGRVLSQTRLA
ncbi:MAG: hypothetical protein ACKN81_11300, partial [Pirellulaceae bacterium]